MSLHEMLMAAVRRGSLADVRSIVETDRVDVNAVDRWGLTPLMQAVSQEGLEMVELLLSMGADPRLRTAEGITAIGLASPVVRKVLEAGAATAMRQEPEPASEVPEPAQIKPVRRLLHRYGDDRALAKLVAIGQPVLPLLQRAYSGLDHDAWMMAQWYNRILALVAPDPVGEALWLVDKVDERPCSELVWVLRRFVSPEDAARLRESLARLLSVDQPEQLVWALPRVAVLCEALGLAGAEEDISLLNRVLDVALGELERLRQAEALHLCGAEVAPAAAACASALLAISERLGLQNEPDRDYWRLVCLDTALPDGYHASYDIGGLMAPPMPLLFARAPGECARFLASLSEAGAQADEILSDVHFWLTTAQEQGVTLDLRPQAGGAQDWLDTLDKRAASAGAKRKETLDLRALVRPGDAQAEAMGNLAGPLLDAAAIEHSLSILRQATPLAAMAALAVESFFVQRSSGRDNSDKGRAALNRLLQDAGLSPTAGWTWQAPPGRLSSGPRPEDLHATLCAAAHACSQAAGASAPRQAAELLAPLRDLLPHALIRHACYRTLLVALKDAPVDVARACLESLRAERDPAMAGAVLRMAQSMLRRRAGPVLLLLLDTPAIRSDDKLAEQLVYAVAAAAPPGAGERLLAFGREIGWGTPAHGSYGVFLALAVSMGRLGVREAVPLLGGLVGTSGLGSEIELALLRLAARYPSAVDDATFARAFERAAADGYADLDPSLMGNQARAFLLQTLREARLGAPAQSQACRFLAETSPGGSPPPLALPLLLRLLPRAMAEAQAHPGEAWEDRNWGGYNNSPEEDLAEIMTRAVESLCAATYSWTNWCILLDGLLDVPDIDQILVAEADPAPLTGVRYAARNVFDALGKNLSRLKNPAVDRALSRTPPTEAFRAVRGVLACDPAGQPSPASRKEPEEASAHE